MTRRDTGEQSDGYLRRRKRRKRLSPIALNMTPMIDVVFLLLVYFVLVAQFGTGGAVLGMEIRQDGSGERDPFALPRRVVRVSIKSNSDDAKDYTVSCDTNGLRGVRTIGSFTNELGAGAQFLADQPISIEPAEGVLWEHALDAYETVHRAGFTNTHLSVGEP